MRNDQNKYLLASPIIFSILFFLIQLLINHLKALRKIPYFSMTFIVLSSLLAGLALNFLIRNALKNENENNTD